MKCDNIRLTEICKSCGVGDKDADCPTVCNEGSTITYPIPPSTIFDLVPYKNHVGEQVVCVEENPNSSDKIRVGEIFTVIRQVNEQYGYIFLDKFDHPLHWFGPDRFKKCKATYGGIEYTLLLNRAVKEV